MPYFLSNLLLVRVLAKLVLESAILKLVHTDVGGNTSREQGVLVQEHKTLDVVRLASEDGGEHPGSLLSLGVGL